MAAGAATGGGWRGMQQQQKKYYIYIFFLSDLIPGNGNQEGQKKLQGRLGRGAGGGQQTSEAANHQLTEVRGCI